MVSSLKLTAGVKLALNRAYKASPDYTALTKFKAGYAQTTPTVGTTDLANPVPITGTESVDTAEATAGWTANTGDTTGIAVSTTRFKQGASSLTFAKSGTGAASCGVNKAVTSRDYTSKNLYFWVYITSLADLISAGTAMEVQYGSDSSNYYRFDIAIGSLVAGWNLFEKASSEASATVGTPAIAACDFFKITFYTDLAADTIAADRINIDEILVASSDDYTKDFEATYPQLDETNMEATIRCVLDSTQANGHLIDSVLLVNTDASVIAGSIDTITEESKTSTDEFIFLLRERFINSSS